MAYFNPIHQALVPRRGTGIAFVVLTWPTVTIRCQYVQAQPVILQSLPHRRREVVTAGMVYKWVMKDGIFRVVRVEDLPACLTSEAFAPITIDCIDEVALA